MTVDWKKKRHKYWMQIFKKLDHACKNNWASVWDDDMNMSITYSPTVTNYIGVNQMNGNRCGI